MVIKMTKSTAPTGSPEDFFNRVRLILSQARQQALQSVNVLMVQAYWAIGQEIIEEEQKGANKAGYGEQLLEGLAKRLTREFGKGFTQRNLRYMRAFYLAFPIQHAVRAELSWTHYRLLSNIDKREARSFYLNECIQSRWSTRELERQIHSLLFERLAMSKDKAGVKTLSEQGHEVFQPSDLIKNLTF